MEICPLSALSGERVSVLPEPYRVGVYYAPAEDDLLWQVGSAWLGRDAQSTLATAQPPLPHLLENTAEPRRYGFHGTLKAPFALRFGFEAFLHVATELAARHKSFTLPSLAVTNLHGFLALCPAEPAPQLHHLADECVKMLDEHRVLEPSAKQAQRAAGKTARQAEHITRWGYPFVFEDFNFHMTLTSQMPDNPYFDAACAYFSAALAKTRQVKELSIFVEETKGAPFKLFCRLPFLA